MSLLNFLHLYSFCNSCYSKHPSENQVHERVHAHLSVSIRVCHSPTQNQLPVMLVPDLALGTWHEWCPASSLDYWGPHSLFPLFSPNYGELCVLRVKICIIQSKWSVLALTLAAGSRQMCLCSPSFFRSYWAQTFTILPVCIMLPVYFT